MCGYVGYISKNEKEINVKILEDMAKKIRHRGPDNFGIWVDTQFGFGVAHNRLSVIDTSKSGNQPMISSNGQFVIAFNGEIYNHLALRQEMQGYNWLSSSDTETLLACIQIWGLKETVKKINGMFSFVLWDIKKKELNLVRDRFGEKPLYYGWQDSTFIFGSELKAFLPHPNFMKEIDRESLNLYFKHTFIPAPYSIYKNINKLLPGTILTLSKDISEPSINKYWDLQSNFLQKGQQCVARNKKTVKNELHRNLRKTIEERMSSDVPLGAFLSGGVDSSLVVSIMQSVSKKPVKTFTMGFKDSNFNEAIEAKRISNFLGTDHHELYVTHDDIIDLLPSLTNLYDEPFSDPSQIPTFLVSKLSKRNVTVALSGDGGDELFCGYSRYHFVIKYWKIISSLPFSVRKLLSHQILKIKTQTWDKLANYLFLSKKYRNFGVKIHKVASAINSKTLMDLYVNILTNWPSEDQLVKKVKNSKKLNLINLDDHLHLTDAEKMMIWDMQFFLSDDILVKLDRATMGCSLEGRVPFLDHNLVEQISKIPFKYKFGKKQSKLILREILNEYLPKNLLSSHKSGFDLPLSEWLRGPLKFWAEDILSPKQIKDQGFLNEEIIFKRWQEHKSGARDWSNQLWGVLVFQLWLKDQLH